jgi:hypothetical protein
LVIWMILDIRLTKCLNFDHFVTLILGLCLIAYYKVGGNWYISPRRHHIIGCLYSEVLHHHMYYTRLVMN